MRTRSGILALVALLIGFGAGLLSARRLLPPSGPAAATTASTHTGASLPKSGQANEGPTGGSAASPRSVGDWERDFIALAGLSSSVARGDQARALADLAPLAQVAQILQLADQQLGGDILYVFVERLLHRLAAVDPKAALGWADRYANRGFDWGLRETIIEAWVGTDPTGALVWFESLGVGHARMQVEDAMAMALARRAPAQGLALVQRLPSGPFKDGFLGQFFDAWGQTDPASAARAGRTLLATTRHAAVLGAVIGQWAQRDPAAARSLLDSLPSGPIRRQAAVATIETLAGVSPAHAAQLALDLANIGSRADLLSIVAQRWGSSDPTGAIQWAESIGDPRHQRAIMTALIESLAQSQPNLALELLQRHRIGGDNEDIFRTLGSELASDPHATLTWLETLPTAGARQAAFSGLIESWTTQDPAAAALYATNLPPGSRRMEAINAVASQLAVGDPDAAVAWLQGLPPGQEKVSAAQGMVWQLAQNDPLKGVTLLESLPEGANRSQLFSSLISGWAGNDLDGAINWVQARPDSPERRAALGSLVGHWAESDPVAAAGFAATLPPGSETDAFVANLAGAWAGQDPQAALTWAQGLSSPSQSQSAMEDIIGRWAENSPADAVAFAQTLTDPATQRNSVLAAVNTWGESNPEQAATWLEALPQGDTQTLAASSLVRSWGASDPVSAAQWLAGQPEALRTDDVVASLASSLSQFEPSSALQWAAAIRDPTRRQTEVVRLGQNWIQNFPGQARDWLQQSNLDAQTRQMIEMALEQAEP